MKHVVPTRILKPLVVAWVEAHGENALESLGAATGETYGTWQKRLSRWWAQRSVPVEEVDRLVVAMGAEHLWHGPLAEWSPRLLLCEDCGKAIEAGDYRPLDLMRKAEGSPSRVLWDATKQKWVSARKGGRRFRKLRRGGRRFRKVDLCRRCAAEALRKRAQPGTVPQMKKTRMGVKVKYATVTENGVTRHMRPTERLEPKRGGRPRLLTDAELRKLHALYLAGPHTRLSLARQLAATRDKGTVEGYNQSMLYGWRRLRLPTIPKGESLKRAHAMNSAWRESMKAGRKERDAT